MLQVLQYLLCTPAEYTHTRPELQLPAWRARQAQCLMRVGAPAHSTAAESMLPPHRTAPARPTRTACAGRAGPVQFRGHTAACAHASPGH